MRMDRDRHARAAGSGRQVLRLTAAAIALVSEIAAAVVLLVILAPRRRPVSST
jgi:hypothetical protein